MSIFKFKEFEVDQTGCAMKINTDGVLLGAIANHSLPENILDVGTGTGVIAMMMAQRFPDALIEAVEIDKQATDTARKNFENSVFSGRLLVNNIAIQQYNSSKKFDLIISNPPFFVNDLKNEEYRKGIARHADEDFFNELVKKAESLLSESGKFWLILPIKQTNEVVNVASLYGLSLCKRIQIHSDETKPTFRQIICLSRIEKEVVETDFYIYQSFQVHTNAYKNLLKDFFLAF